MAQLTSDVALIPLYLDAASRTTSDLHRSVIWLFLTS